MTSEKKPIIAQKQPKIYLNNLKSYDTLYKGKSTNDIFDNRSRLIKFINNRSTSSNNNQANSLALKKEIRKTSGNGGAKGISQAVDRSSKKEIVNFSKQKETRKIIYSKWGNDDPKQKIIQKLWVKNPDLDMIATFLAENGNLNIKLRSYIIGKNGYYDYGLCQINKGYHKKIVNHPNFYNLDFQIQKCVELYKNGTKFYGFNNRMKFKKYLIFN